ncbi:alpha-L-fucosidase [Chitinophaga arvensicola]|uniref:alpha-L-fucosidase n=1 Tax=Chitinophaga arvensicola TaxID=29529 RepID=A0A1I0S818_9BACT|nr:alpha-L-fucosidase [Chitinophaga arvensicola]SEW52019.1 alpha-L-fucosidase [Chitinophaga arvensicola]
MKKTLLFILICASTFQGSAQTKDLQQLQSDFVDLRFGVMMHFNMGTFTNEEWASPDHDPALFNPAQLDCNQWADACKAAGMTYGILTVKHHDGFCLWDSKYTDYDVASSPLKRDVVGEYVKAFRSRGLKPCLYFSMWDRHNGVENGGPKEEAFVMNQLTELLTNYGEIPLIIFDGWNWKMGHRLISYQRIYDHIKKLQPNCLVSDHNGNGTLQTDIIYYEGPKGVYPPGNNIYPSQMALTLTDGWFWHPGADKQVKSLDYALDKLQRVIPLYCNFMINIGPNRDGLFDKEVVARLQQIGKAWKRDQQRLPLPQQPAAIKSFIRVAAISATEGEAVIVPAGPANAGSPVAAILDQKKPEVMIDGISDVVGDRGGFSPFQTYWKFSPSKTPGVVLDLGEEKSFSKLYYLPAQLMGYSGIITKYILSVGHTPDAFIKVKEGDWSKTDALKVTTFSPVKARYIKLEIAAAIDDPMISEIGIGN